MRLPREPREITIDGGLVHKRGKIEDWDVMDYDVAFFMNLTPGVVHNFPKAVGVYDFCPLRSKKGPRVLFKKNRGQPWEIWSLVSIIDGSTLPQVCGEEQLC